MTSKIYIPLDSIEHDALVTLSRSLKRDPRDQAAILIRHELERIGLLKPELPREATNDRLIPT